MGDGWWQKITKIQRSIAPMVVKGNNGEAREGSLLKTIG
jgi:hypothetical protein